MKHKKTALWTLLIAGSLVFTTGCNMSDVQKLTSSTENFATADAAPAADDDSNSSDDKDAKKKRQSKSFGQLKADYQKDKRK